MKHGIRLLLWPGVLILLVLAILGVNAALIVVASSTTQAPSPPTSEVSP